jgi:hypothetical protein
VAAVNLQGAWDHLIAAISLRQLRKDYAGVIPLMRVKCHNHLRRQKSDSGTPAGVPGRARFGYPSRLVYCLHYLSEQWTLTIASGEWEVELVNRYLI